MGSQTAFGPRGSATVLSKATTIAAALFMITSLSLAILATRHAGSSQSVLDRQKKPPVKTTPGPVQPVKPLPSVQIGPDGGPAVPVPIQPPPGKK
jgi:preprotein translocase subunit SecG